MGAFDTVYECHSELNDKYTIKILKANDNNAISRFQKEVRLTSRLNHPNIIKIVAQDTTGDRKYYIILIRI
ncbi:protein kinase [Lachnoclostridium edouardi]|uniref:protein kinase n=1 Tax=Lachnoclostridium edouardi TaxID=1926283 RepID=UPI0038CBF883